MADIERWNTVPVKTEGTSIPYDEFSGRVEEDDQRLVTPKYETLKADPDWNKAAPTTKYICQCGSDEFRAYYKSGGHETSIRCTDCNEIFIVHEG